MKEHYLTQWQTIKDTISIRAGWQIVFSMNEFKNYHLFNYLCGLVMFHLIYIMYGYRWSLKQYSTL